MLTSRMSSKDGTNPGWGCTTSRDPDHPGMRDPDETMADVKPPIQHQSTARNVTTPMRWSYTAKNCPPMSRHMWWCYNIYTMMISQFTDKLNNYIIIKLHKLVSRLLRSVTTPTLQRTKAPRHLQPWAATTTHRYPRMHTEGTNAPHPEQRRRMAMMIHLLLTVRTRPDDHCSFTVRFELSSRGV